VVRVPMAEWRSFRATCGGEGRQEAIRGIVSAPNQACLSLAAKSALSQPLPAPGVRRRVDPGEWRWKIIRRKKPKQAAIALANRMARTAYALMKNKTEFRAAQAAWPRQGQNPCREGKCIVR